MKLNKGKKDGLSLWDKGFILTFGALYFGNYGRDAAERDS
jgi:hypothetical protein